jgi:hypothetical protein
MGQIYQPRNPSVAYQASKSLSNPGPQQAIDNSGKIAELGRQAGNYLGNYSQQALRNQEFQATALSRANEVNLQNTRNSIAAFEASQRGDLAKAELMGRADLKADITKVNLLETNRVIESGKANAAADSFEAVGRPNEAALIRSNNPFYLQGIQEATAMKAGVGYGTFLTNAVEKANLQQTDPGYQQQLIALVDQTSKEYIKQQGLDQVNPAILAKYFGYQKAQTEAAIIAGYNNQNNKAVKETLLATAESLAFNNYRTIAGLPAAQQESEILKVVSEANRQANVVIP